MEGLPLPFSLFLASFLTMGCTFTFRFIWRLFIVCVYVVLFFVPLLLFPFFELRGEALGNLCIDIILRGAETMADISVIVALSTYHG